MILIKSCPALLLNETWFAYIQPLKLLAWRWLQTAQANLKHE